MLMLALRLILKGKGGKQHCLPFVDSNLGMRCFWKRGSIRKGCVEREDWGTAVCVVLGFKKILCKAWLLFNCFLAIKGILKALFSFIPW